MTVTTSGDDPGQERLHIGLNIDHAVQRLYWVLEKIGMALPGLAGDGSAEARLLVAQDALHALFPSDVPEDLRPLAQEIQTAVRQPAVMTTMAAVRDLEAKLLSLRGAIWKRLGHSGIGGVMEMATTVRMTATEIEAAGGKNDDGGQIIVIRGPQEGGSTHECIFTLPTAAEVDKLRVALGSK